MRTTILLWSWLTPHAIVIYKISASMIYAFLRSCQKFVGDIESLQIIQIESNKKIIIFFKKKTKN